MSDAIDRAKKRFGTYAGLDAPGLPPEESSVLQVRLSRWQSKNFGSATAEQIALGVAEESGELCHSVLKRSQGIRGMEDSEKYLEAAGDAIADTAIYLMQMATLLRLDFGELVAGTAEVVMARDWTKPAPGTCADCGEHPGGRSFSDVPGKGTLCLPCHETWAG